MPDSIFTVGLDLGQQADPTAISVIESVEDGDRYRFPLRHLERLPLGVSYVDMVNHVVSLMQRPPLPGATLVADQTGVGRPITDMLRRAEMECRLVPVTITGGSEVSGDRWDGFRVPKCVLVSTGQLLIQSGRLTWPRTLPLIDVFAQELANFRVKITKSANETYEAREGEHDDLVLSVLLACWFAENYPPPGPSGEPLNLEPDPYFRPRWMPHGY
jgi:hypothetical protein